MGYTYTCLSYAFKALYGKSHVCMLSGGRELGVRKLKKYWGQKSRLTPLLSLLWSQPLRCNLGRSVEGLMKRKEKKNNLEYQIEQHSWGVLQPIVAWSIFCLLDLVTHIHHLYQTMWVNVQPTQLMFPQGAVNHFECRKKQKLFCGVIACTLFALKCVLKWIFKIWEPVPCPLDLQVRKIRSRREKTCWSRWLSEQGQQPSTL